MNRNEHNSGRQRTGRSAENIENVRQVLEAGNNRYLSCRRNMLQLPSATFNRIVRLDLNWYPYKIHVRHQLQAADYQRRVNYSRWLIQQDADFWNNVIIGDEATFSVNGNVNTRNVREYAPMGTSTLVQL